METAGGEVQFCIFQEVNAGVSQRTLAFNTPAKFLNIDVLLLAFRCSAVFQISVHQSRKRLEPLIAEFFSAEHP